MLEAADSESNTGQQLRRQGLKFITWGLANVLFSTVNFGVGASQPARIMELWKLR